MQVHVDTFPLIIHYLNIWSSQLITNRTHITTHLTTHNHTQTPLTALSDGLLTEIITLLQLNNSCGLLKR